jgi:hypothetical protein
MNLDVENAADLVDRFVREELPGIAYPSGRFAGRGIVIAAGGPKYRVNAWVAVNMLRRVGCRLPVECWHLGQREFDAKWAELVGPLGATCVDAVEVSRRRPQTWLQRHERLHGWELKPYAILHSRFQEVLLLDADNVPVLDPAELFETAEFRRCGAIFWPDYGRLAPDRPAWKVFGNVPYRDEPEFESGQIVLDKRACWQCLVLCHWYMQRSDFFFRRNPAIKCDELLHVVAGLRGAGGAVRRQRGILSGLLRGQRLSPSHGSGRSAANRRGGRGRRARRLADDPFRPRL